MPSDQEESSNRSLPCHIRVQHNMSRVTLYQQLTPILHRLNLPVNPRSNTGQPAGKTPGDILSAPHGAQSGLARLKSTVILYRHGVHIRHSMAYMAHNINEMLPQILFFLFFSLAGDR